MAIGEFLDKRFWRYFFRRPAVDKLSLCFLIENLEFVCDF